MMNGTRRTFQFLVATVALTLILGGLATTGEVAATEATGWQDFSAACVGDGGIPTSRNRYRRVRVPQWRHYDLRLSSGRRWPLRVPQITP